MMRIGKNIAPRALKIRRACYKRQLRILKVTNRPLLHRSELELHVQFVFESG